MEFIIHIIIKSVKKWKATQTPLKLIKLLMALIFIAGMLIGSIIGTFITEEHITEKLDQLAWSQDNYFRTTDKLYTINPSSVKCYYNAYDAIPCTITNLRDNTTRVYWKELP